MPTMRHDSERRRHELLPERSQRITQTFGKPDDVLEPLTRSSAPARSHVSIIKHLFGTTKKPLPASAVADKIAELHEQIATEQTRQSQAKNRLADLAILTDADHAAAEADVAAAGRTIARLTAAIEQLDAEHAILTKAEAIEAFRKRRDQAAARAEKAKRRLQTEYVSAATIVASIVDEVAASERDIAALRREARDLGETVNIVDPSDFRHRAKEFEASWPNERPKPASTLHRVTRVIIGGDDAGVTDTDDQRACTHHVSGFASDAPAWAVKWIDGEPVEACDGVVITERSRRYAANLQSNVSLPGLMWNDPRIFPSSN